MGNKQTRALQDLLARQEMEMLQCLATIREQQMLLEGEKKLFRLYINTQTKSPIYYAHLFDDNGKQTDCRMSCQTTDKEKAALYAIEHRDDFLKGYYAKKSQEDFYQLLTEYYTENSELFERARQHRSVRPQQVKGYRAFIDNYFLPFLKLHKISTFEKANALEVIENFQNYCKDGKQNGNYSLKPETINRDISCTIAPIFNQVLKEKSVFVLNKKISLPLKNEDKTAIGLIPIRTTFSILLNDLFWQKADKATANSNIPFLTNKIRNMERFRLFCLLSNLCGLRNSEIYLLRKENILKIGGTYFLNIENSRIDGTGTKTEAGKRLIPLHPITHTKLIQYIEKNNKTDYIFKSDKSQTIPYTDFSRARNIFALLCGYDNDTIKEHNIVFYSFRHFFKTMMTNALNEKDYVEYLMGHTNKSDMSKVYLDFGSVGNKYLENNGRKVIEAIDNYYRDLYREGKGKINGEEIEAYFGTLQDPIVKEVWYNDLSSSPDKKYLIRTIPDPEKIEDVIDYDDDETEKSFIEKMNESNPLR
jgi:integrase